MKPSGVGGMAVMEGVMMKNKDEYAVAVRKPNNEIAVEKSTHKDFSDKVKLFKLPIFRGMLAFVDSMVIGFKVLNFSASFFEDEDEDETQNMKDKKKNKKAKVQDDDFEMEEVSLSKVESNNKDNSASDLNEAQANPKDEKSNALLMIFAVLISILISITLFMVLPVLITGLFSRFIDSKILMSFIEGMIRLTIFICYVILASKMPEIKRVFMYHGAEHKTINCLENGFELTVENVRKQTKQHKRCGTSFMLLVILISLLFFMVFPVNGLLMKIASRVLFVPFIAGISYEFIRLAGKSESKLVHVISQPGLWMQGLTTKEPDDSMIEVAIKSVESVFDWRAFLESSVVEEKKVVKHVSQIAEPSKKQVTNNSEKVDNKKHTTAIKQEVEKKQNAVKKQNTEKKQDFDKKQDADKKHNTDRKQTADKKSSDKKLTSDVKTASDKTKVTTKLQDVAIENEPASKTTAAALQPEISKRNTGAAPVNFKPLMTDESEEEDDEILKALDKFFDNPQDAGKIGEA